MARSPYGRYLCRSSRSPFYRVRIVLPEAARQHLGGIRELRRSLGTANLRQARLMASAVYHQLLATLLTREWPDGSRVTIEGLKVDTPEELQELLRRLDERETTATKPPKAPRGAAIDWPDLWAQYRDEKHLVKAWTAKTAQENTRSFGFWQAAKFDAVAMKDRLKARRLNPETINKHVLRCATFVDWAISHRYFGESNPFTGLAIAVPRSATRAAGARREVWTTAEVAALLSKLDPRSQPQHWLPILGAYTGARINELCQLHLDDIDIEHGLIRITHEGGVGKRVKTHASVRQVPLHSRVIALGFFDFIESREAHGATRVFPQFPMGRDGYGQAGSK